MVDDGVAVDGSRRTVIGAPARLTTATSSGLGSVESGGSGSSLDLFRFSFRSLVRVPFDLSPFRSSYGSGLRSTAQVWLGIGVYVGSESPLFRYNSLTQSIRFLLFQYKWNNSRIKKLS
ncbi:hypothetical protein Hanom_Chr12g01122081 [Helianthus anomalus]